MFCRNLYLVMSCVVLVLVSWVSIVGMVMLVRMLMIVMMIRILIREKFCWFVCVCSVSRLLVMCWCVFGGVLVFDGWGLLVLFVGFGVFIFSFF